MEIICKCIKVTDETIIDSIKKGNNTFEKIQESTTAGTGMCRSLRCRKK